LRSALIGLLALVLTIAEARSQANFNCSEAYKRTLDEIDLRKPSPERLAAQRRQAMRAYHACLTGDVHDPKALFERLDRSNS
jgi:hypothetical protein